jgi:CelD/BcsL family acetyltransferase involved in cellulose biosynthesis
MTALITRCAERTVACVPLLDALEHEAAAWDRLLDASSAASLFAGRAWHRAWIGSAPPEEVAASHALLVTGADGAIAGVLPLGVRDVTFRRRPVRALTWAIGDVGCPDQLDLLALPDADFDAVVPVLASLPGDLLILDNLAEDAPNAGRLGEALKRGGWCVRRTARFKCPYLDLPVSWDHYLASLSANRRQVLRRRERNLARDHVATLTDYGVGSIAAGWRHLVALHEQRWAAEGGGGGTFSDPRVERMHREFAEELARGGQLWLTTLDLDGTPAAAWYGFTDRDTVYFYQSGRDPRWEDKSVGVALMVNMIRRAIERGYRRFDFLRGDEAYKLQWTAAHSVTQELVAFRPGWRGRWLRCLDMAGRLRARLRTKRRR